jgi:hypothetical protein
MFVHNTADPRGSERRARERIGAATLFEIRSARMPAPAHAGTARGTTTIQDAMSRERLSKTCQGQNVDSARIFSRVVTDQQTRNSAGVSTRSQSGTRAFAL